MITDFFCFYFVFEQNQPNQIYVNIHPPPDNETDDSLATNTGLPDINTICLQRLPISSTPTIQISIDIQPPTPEERSSNRPKDLIIPKLIVEHASPTRERLPVMYPGSPPPQRASVGETNFFAPNKQQQRR